MLGSGCMVGTGHCKGLLEPGCMVGTGHCKGLLGSMYGRDGVL